MSKNRKRRKLKAKRAQTKRSRKFQKAMAALLPSAPALMRLQGVSSQDIQLPWLVNAWARAMVRGDPGPSAGPFCMISTRSARVRSTKCTS